MPLALFVLFLVVPLVELFVIVRVGDVLGLPLTLVALLAVSVVGAWLVRREGRGAWRRLRQAFGRAQVPAVEVVDGALVLVGGALLLTPGFLTDLVGLLLVVPPTRAIANRAVRSRVRAAFVLPAAPSGRFGGRARSRRSPQGPPVDVEVVKVERTSSERPPRRST